MASLLMHWLSILIFILAMPDCSSFSWSIYSKSNKNNRNWIRIVENSNNLYEYICTIHIRTVFKSIFQSLFCRALSIRYWAYLSNTTNFTFKDIEPTYQIQKVSDSRIKTKIFVFVKYSYEFTLKIFYCKSTKTRTCDWCCLVANI